MKKLIALLVTFSFVGLLSAQTIEKNEYKSDNEVRTVMNSIQIHRISGFGGPTMSYSTINGDFAFMMGGGGGILINNLFLGGYGEGLSNTVDIGGNNSIRELDFGHGGFWVGYEIAHKWIIHPVISSRLGWGGITGFNTTSNRYFQDNVFVFVPTISAEVNLTRFFKVNVGAEYRQTLNVDNVSGMSNKDFSGLGVYMNFLFGWF
jgi:hypothetical protein